MHAAVSPSCTRHGVDKPECRDLSPACRFQICDTADFKSALPGLPNHQLSTAYHQPPSSASLLQPNPQPSTLNPQPTATYHPEHFQPLFAAEDRHFWFRSRSRCIAAAAHLIPGRAELTDVLEHGCGTGYVLAGLPRLFPRAQVVGADLFAAGLKLAQRRFAGPLIQTDLIHCGFRAAFDLIGLFDVLEHLDDDVQVLRSLRDQLRAGGWLLLTVPAHMSLWSDYDIASGHRRRYTIPQLESRLRETGFSVEYSTEFMMPLLPLMSVRRRMSWRTGANGKGRAKASVEQELHAHPLINRMLELILRPEPIWIAKRKRLPLGTSLLALAQRSRI